MNSQPENPRESESSRKIDGPGPPKALDNTFLRTFSGDDGHFAGNEQQWLVKRLEGPVHHLHDVRNTIN